MKYSVETMEQDMKLIRSMQNWKVTPSLKLCGLSKREFYGEDFYKFLLREYETARVFLKNCGRPKDEHDRFLIDEAKFSSAYYKRMITEDDQEIKK